MVLEILDLLAAAQVDGWVAGGWGIDALAGRETRRHYDLDVVLDKARNEYPRVAETLTLANFRLRAEYQYPKQPMPLRYEWIHSDGRSVIDVLPVDLDRPPFSSPPEQLADGSAAPAFASGRINGLPVPCLSARLQAELHSGYPPRIKDAKDFEVLRDVLQSPGAHRLGEGFLRQQRDVGPWSQRKRARTC